MTKYRVTIDEIISQDFEVEADGTKTVVKCQNDGLSGIEPFDPEKGLAMAFMKKMLGNKGNYYNTVDKWVYPYWRDIHDKQATVIETYWRTKFNKAFNTLAQTVIDDSNGKGDEQS